MKSSLIAAFLLAAAVSALAQDTTYKGLGAESVTPEVIAKYAPPPLDPRFTRDIELLLDVRAPGLGIPSPDGKTALLRMGHHGHAAGVSPRPAEGLSDPDDGRRGAHHAARRHAGRQMARARARYRRPGKPRPVPAIRARRSAAARVPGAEGSGVSRFRERATAASSITTRTTSRPTATRSTGTTSRAARARWCSARRDCGRSPTTRAPGPTSSCCS